MLPPPDEIIDDSEPEREERRKQRKLKRKIIPTSSKLHSTSLSAQGPGMLQGTIIEISDDSDIPESLGLAKRVGHEVNKSPHSGGDPFASKATNLAQKETIADEPTLYEHRSSTQLAKPASRGLPIPVDDDSPELCPPTTQMSPNQSDVLASPEELSRPFNIARYAYAGARSSSVLTKSRSASRAASVTTSDIQRPTSTSSTKLPSDTNHRFTEFEDDELARILRCPACDLAWTSRKTVLQKMKHIQTCAKKLHFTDETITVLLRKQLETVPPLKGDPVEVEEPGTLLEEAVKVGEKKKSGPRRKIVATIKDLSETRQDILDRAKNLLDKGPAAKSSAAQLIKSPDASASIPSSLPPLTQPFGQSSLAMKFRSNVPPEPTPFPVYVPSPPSLPSALPASPTDLLFSSPPRTQAFGESSLARQYQTKHSVIDVDSPSVYITSPLATLNRIQDALDASPTPRTADLPEDLSFDPTSPKFAAQQPAYATGGPASNSMSDLDCVPVLMDNFSANEQVRYSLSPRSNPPEYGQVHHPFNYEPQSEGASHDHQALFEPLSAGDSAMLHYNPDIPLRASSPLLISNTRLRRSLSRSFSSSEDDLPRIPSALKGKKPARSPRRRAKRNSSTSEVPSKTAPKKRGRKPASKSQQDPTESISFPEEELYNKLKSCILNDTQLYLQILRYEPIHFDIFLQLALDLGLPPSKVLRLRVKSFLDKQAIHFYGYDITGPRTRKPRK